MLNLAKIIHFFNEFKFVLTASKASNRLTEISALINILNRRKNFRMFFNFVL